MRQGRYRKHQRDGGSHEPFEPAGSRHDDWRERTCATSPGFIPMKRQLHVMLVLWTSVSLAVSGCAPTQPYFFFEDGDMSHYVGMATAIEHPDLDTQRLSEVEHAGPPLTVSDPEYAELWELALQDAVRITLENSKVIRTIRGAEAQFGGQRPQEDTAPSQLLALAGNPEAVSTVYDAALAESDPNFGPEGALSAFDAQLGSALFWEKNDRPQNLELRIDTNGDGVPDALDPNLERFGFARIRRQDLGQFNTTLSKRLVTGGRVAVAANTIYEFSNVGRRELPSDWTQNFEFQFSQPLLQGSGLLFNRIAGPFDPFNGAGSPNFDGVLIARINTDIRLADFEANVRNLVREVEGAYWDLYFAYRNLEARKVGRDSALATWRKVKALSVEGARGGEADKEAQAREQFYFFRAEVETALSDLFNAESRLRYLMGLTATDGRLISPATEPGMAHVEFDWHEIHAESLVRSAELRQQRWRIKRAELELMAAKNLLLPRLDLVTRYRWLGLGDELINSDGRGYSGSNEDILADTDAFSTLTDGNFQESQIGINMNIPLGFRRELATVRNQQLQVAENRAILQDQELELSHALANAVRVLNTSYTLMQTNFNRVVAAQRQVEALDELFRLGTITVDLVLDAQRRLADALTSAYRAQADYNAAIAQVHFRKGSLLEYNGVYLAEGPWPGKAYFDAHRRGRARDAALFLDYGFSRPDVISRGPASQQIGDMVPQGAIYDGQIIHDGMPVPAPGEPTPAPAPPPTDPSKPMEELPTPPGPATMKPLRTPTQLSKHQTPSAQPAQFEHESSSKSGSSGGFDWKLERPTEPKRDVSVMKAAASTPVAGSSDKVANTTKIRLTVGESKDSAWQNSQVRVASAQEEAGESSGWKRASK
jgi:outer membrane protein TolC